MEMNAPTTPEGSEYMSRKERRQAQRQEQQRSAGGRRLGRRLLTWGISLGVLFGIGWGIVKLSNNVPLPTQGGDLAVAVSGSDLQSGPSDAPITLVEYGDFQCPACGAYHPLIVQLLAEPALKDKVRLVFRHFPLTQVHPNAQLASQAAQAASLQGKFWQMHDKLYENQNKWSGQSSAGAQETFIGYAVDIGLTVDQFKKDIDSAVVKDKIKADVASGNQSVIQGTPTFFINGKLMPTPQSYEQFKQFVMAPLSSPLP